MKRKRYREGAARARIMAEKRDLAEQNSDNELETDDLPQVVTESYGTGVKYQPGYNIGDRRNEYDDAGNVEASPEITGGDIDARWDLEATVGDEAVGGTVPTPDQDIVEEIAAGVGVEINDDEDVRITEMLEERDDSRWELDPLSSEDYGDRKTEGIQEEEIERLDADPNEYGGSARSLTDSGIWSQEPPPGDHNV